MTYVIAEPCIGVKDRACVPACPVDCIWEYDEPTNKLVVKDIAGSIKESRDPNADFTKEQLLSQLFIDPVTCIDCSACVDVCPPHAIFAEDDLPPDFEKFTVINNNVFI